MERKEVMMFTEAEIAEKVNEWAKRNYGALPVPKYVAASRYAQHLLAQLESARAENQSFLNQIGAANDEINSLDTRWTAALNLVRRKAEEWEARVPNSDDPSFKYHYRTRSDAARELLEELEQMK
jgi:hypothetical protein